MQCPSCSHESPPDSAYCGVCGGRLVRTCPGCEHPNPPEHAFCSACGARLEGRPAASLPSPEAERRQLTVMFCDLVGSTALSGQLDVEELRAVMRAYHETSTEPIVEHYEGHVAQHLGDGLLAYFGYPHAHEDDAVRGVSAALALMDEMPRLSEKIRESLPTLGDLQVRIGVHSGPVVVGDMGGGVHRERLALGETVNVASHLLSVCEPGEVVISEATRRLARGAFVFEDRGRHPIKGVGEPMGVHRVVRGSGATTRLARDASAGLTPLVGREQEISLLLDRWEQAAEGRGQVVLMCGEAGVGKSRLVQTLRERLADVPHGWLEATGSAYHRSSAFHPIIELLERTLHLERDDSPEAKIAKLVRTLEDADFEVPDALALLASLLSISAPGFADPPLPPETRRKRTLDLLAAWVFGRTAPEPTVLVVEDVNWADPSSLELLGRLVEQTPTAPLLLLVTSRPGFEPTWPGRSRTLQLTLNPLSRRLVVQMVDALTQGATLPAEVVEQIVDKTDGVPLFVEELTRMVLESGLVEEREGRYELPGPLPPLAIPATLQDSLMARLDRLGQTRELAQLCAVLGREFSYELLTAVATLPPEALHAGLDQLVAADLFYRRGARPHETYTFKHAMIRDTAYQSLLKSIRQQHHARIAQVLAYDRKRRFGSVPELVAHHYAEAGLVTPAIEHYERAGQLAAARFQNEEAMAHFERALALLRTLPRGRERDERELELHVTLGPAVHAARGYWNESAERLWGRAREICDRLGDTPKREAVLGGLGAFLLTRGELDAASEVAESLLAHGERTHDEIALLRGHVQRCGVDMVRGQGESTVEHCERALEIYSLESHGHLVRHGAWDPAAYTRSFAAWALWSLGYPDRALEYGRAALAHARALEHPYSLAFTIMFTAGVHFMRRDRESERALNEECLELSERYAFPLTLGISKATGAWFAMDESGGADRLEQVSHGLSVAAGTGNRFAAPFVLSNVAGTHRALGCREPALQTLDAGLAIARETGQCFWDAELLRQKGELALDDGDRVGAEKLFTRALEIARAQRARSHELRAATSLARLRQGDGRGGEVRELLEPLYAAFTEGFDTPDLVDAKALLDA